MQKNKSYRELQIGEIVTSDFRAAEIFTKAGIDFCCGGNKTLSVACREKEINEENLIRQFEELEKVPDGNTLNFKDWDLSFLADYITNTHHKYILKTLPDLLFYTRKVADVHGSHHPELVEIADLFSKINHELLQHLQKEEDVLFPAIKEAQKSKSQYYKNIIKSETDRMWTEHEFAGGAMDKINQLSSAYLIPEDACNTYKVTLQLLQEFENNLHIHVHLENNILYPKALLI